MYCLGYFAIFIYLFLMSIAAEINLLSKENFGSVKPTVVVMELCKGPKRLNCSDIDLHFNGDMGNVSFVYYVKKNTQITKTKIAIWMFKNSSASPDVQKWVDKPCAHFFFAPVLTAAFNTNENCVVKKGTYTINLNITALFYELVGFQFFYGIYRSRSTIMSRDCNVVCVHNEFRLDHPKKNVSTAS